MNVDTITTLLVAIAPALASIATIICGIVKMTAMLKKSNEETTANIESKTDKMEKAFKDMATLKTKVESVERYLLENKKK